MCDEADKAPLEVVAVLKGLVEDGQMVLSDGRRILAPGLPVPAGLDAARVLRIHENFKMLVLANRPGFPFLGNDFFRECGDIFACHVVGNPDPASQEQMLAAYGPDVPRPLLRRLIGAFQELRSLEEEGSLSYPYSARELVAVTRHLQVQRSTTY